MKQLYVLPLIILACALGLSSAADCTDAQLQTFLSNGFVQTALRIASSNTSESLTGAEAAGGRCNGIVDYNRLFHH